MTITASNLPGLPCRIILTRGTSPAQYWNRTAGAFEAKNTAHAADYAWAMTEGTTPDERGYVVYSHPGTFVGVPDGDLTVTCLDGTGGLDADEVLAFARATGTITGGVWSNGPAPAVGKYVTQADLEEHYDADVIRQWSRKGPDATTTDVAAVQAAITTGEALVDAKLRKQYVLPLTGPSGSGPISAADAAILLGIARPVAASELFFSRPQQQGSDEANSLKADRRDALAELELYTTGVQYLDAPRIDRTPTAPGIA